MIVRICCKQYGSDCHRATFRLGTEIRGVGEEISKNLMVGDFGAEGMTDPIDKLGEIFICNKSCATAAQIQSP